LIENIGRAWGKWKSQGIGEEWDVAIWSRPKEYRPRRLEHSKKGTNLGPRDRIQLQKEKFPGDKTCLLPIWQAIQTKRPERTGFSNANWRCQWDQQTKVIKGHYHMVKTAVLPEIPKEHY